MCFLYTLQDGVTNRVLPNAVDSNGTFEIYTTSTGILKFQKNDGSILYDASELSFNSVDTSSLLNINNIDILRSINNNASMNDVYKKTDIDVRLNLKAGKSST